MKRAIAIISSLVIVLGVATACGKKADTKYPEYVTDANGEYVTDENGDIVTTMVDAEDASVEYITDENGKKVLDDNGEYETVVHFFKNEKVTDAKGETVTEKDGSAKTTKTDKAETTASVDDIGEIETDVQKTETTVKPGEVTQTGERIFETKYKKIIESKNFTLKMSASVGMDGTNISMPMVFAVKGNEKMFVEVKYSGLKLQMIGKDKKIYVVLPALKSYYVSDNTDDDFNASISEITDGITNTKLKYTKTTTVKIGKDDYICEEYSDGEIAQRYYFTKSGKELKRIEITDVKDSSESTIINVTALTAGASDSYFNIPKTYKEANIEELVSGIS